MQDLRLFLILLMFENNQQIIFLKNNFFKYYNIYMYNLYEYFLYLI
jgi:hypothetical protein